ncbi:MAG: glycosyltransferase, partial [Deltaproteobacteria bacterium]|nr:glycosyltransferase [Deltaproteobacteria bacterium]
SSQEPIEGIHSEFPRLNIDYIHHHRPSASAQRNIGLRYVDPDTDLIGFLDDDIVLEDGAMEKMLQFWQRAPEDLGGCAFNLRNPPLRKELPLKNSRLAEWLGVYSKNKGVVTPSGWHTLSGTVSETMFVEWLPSTASVWRKSVFGKFQFDEYFDGYSYLEDLDFSYGVSKKYKLAVVAEAGFYHYPSPSGRISQYDFGKIEVANRLYLVRKHGLSVPRCYLGLLLRLLVTLGASATRFDTGNLQRAVGNCVGLALSRL